MVFIYRAECPIDKFDYKKQNSIIIYEYIVDNQLSFNVECIK